MRAVVKYGRQPGNVAVQEVAEPTISPDQVLVEVGAVGVCGSDIHLWHENQSWTIQCPVILGHEWAGTIVDVGENVAGWSAGERVAVETARQMLAAGLRARLTCIDPRVLDRRFVGREFDASTGGPSGPITSAGISH